jgi:hypothetical protein
MGHWVPVPTLAELPHHFPSISKTRVFQIVLPAWRLFCTGGKRSTVTHAAVRRKGFGSATSEPPGLLCYLQSWALPNLFDPSEPQVEVQGKQVKNRLSLCHVQCSKGSRKKPLFWAADFSQSAVNLCLQGTHGAIHLYLRLEMIQSDKPCARHPNRPQLLPETTAPVPVEEAVLHLFLSSCQHILGSRLISCYRNTRNVCRTKAMWEAQKKATIFQLRRETLEETNPGDTLTLDLNLLNSDRTDLCAAQVMWHLLWQPGLSWDCWWKFLRT